jgi:hypothetical protein
MRREIWIALLLVVAVNAVVLAGVTRNRAGSPEGTLTLTERELPLVAGLDAEENSGVSLRLDWRPYGDDWGWFGREKLAGTGFDPDLRLRSEEEGDRYREPLPRKAFAVLEYDGEAWGQHKAKREKELAELSAKVEKGAMTAEQAKNERQQIEGDLFAGSRLFVIDVGRDPQELRRRYSDRSRFAIIAAKVGMRRHRPAGPGSKAEPKGYVAEVLVDSLHIPRDLQTTLRGLKAEQGRLYPGMRFYSPDRKLAPRYEVRVNWGGRLEPWVEEVRLVAGQE